MFNNYSSYLTSRGRFDEAITVRKRAFTFDPLSVRYNSFFGETLYFARRYDQAIDQLRETLEVDPNDVRTHEPLAQSYAMKGMAAESVAEWERVLTLSGDAEAAVLLRRKFEEQGYEAAMKTLGRARLDHLQRRRSRGQYVPAMNFVVPYLQLGDRVTALDWLDRAFNERNRLVLFIGVDPALDPLRDEPRFQSILRRLKL